MTNAQQDPTNGRTEQVGAEPGHYRVESSSDDTGRVRPAADNHHEFEARDDDEVVRIATAYATSQHKPGTRSRVYRRSFLGWVPVTVLDA